MTETPGKQAAGDAPDLEELARRLLDLWQDQLSAVAANPDLATQAARLMAATPLPGMWLSQLGQMGGAGIGPGNDMTKLWAKMTQDWMAQDWGKGTHVDRPENDKRGVDQPGAGQSAQSATATASAGATAAAAASGPAAATWTNSAAALPALSSALANLHSNPQNLSQPASKRLHESLAQLGPRIQQADPAALMAALQAEGRRRFGQLLTGIENYRKHDYRRDAHPAPVLWDQGTTKLRDYRTQKDSGKSNTRPRVLVIPSLVNRYYVLDLEPQASFLRWLDGNGFDPFVVDWDGPGYFERGFTLTDYIAGRLEGALKAVRREPGGPVYLAGYCMGGNLALALALRKQADIAGLICLATPWDFHAENKPHAEMMGQIGHQLEPVLQTLSELPVDMLQAFFSGLDPFQVLKKFQYFGGLEQSSDSARRFVALEDWLNDGISLAAPVARECLTGWYGENTPQNLHWKVDGKVVDPAHLARPVLNVIPHADRIVPPESARALTRRLKQVDELVPNAGHIGMMVGRAAEREVWQPVAAWMRSR